MNISIKNKKKQIKLKLIPILEQIEDKECEYFANRNVLFCLFRKYLIENY